MNELDFKKVWFCKANEETLASSRAIFPNQTSLVFTKKARNLATKHSIEARKKKTIE